MTLMWYVKEMYRVNSVSPGRGRKGVCRGVWGSPKRKTKAGARSLGSEKEKGREEGNRK